MEAVFEGITIRELGLVQQLAQQTSLRALSRAKKLQISYLSKSLRRIEKKLGCSLFVRSAKGVVLTPEGLRIAQIAGEILSAAQKLSSDTSAEKSTPAFKLLSIAAPRFICSSLLPQVLADTRSFPYRYRVLDMAPDQITSAAFASACEVVITVDEPALSAAWEIKSCGKLAWGVFASVRHPLPSQARQSEVLQFPFIVPNYWTGKRFELGNDHCPVEWKDRLHGDETSAISSALEVVRLSSQQLVYSPVLAARQMVRNGELREIQVAEWPEVSKNIYLGVRSDRVARNFQKRVLDSLKAMLR